MLRNTSFAICKWLLMLGLFSCHPAPEKTGYESDQLRISPLSAHTWLHTSYLETESFGLVPCNGLILIREGEALVLETPTTDSVSEELIQWVEQQGAKLKGVVAHHFHVDCLGGLEAFHARGIPSYAHAATLPLAEAARFPLPQQLFDSLLTLSVGGEEVEVRFFGEGHTADNVVSYLQEEQLLFGGCLVKSVGSGKGNLADASPEQWTETITRVQAAYPEVQVVIPGHGKVGGAELLSFTAELFSLQH